MPLGRVGRVSPATNNKGALVELRGRTCTIFPISPEGAILPPDIDCTEIVKLFQDRLVHFLGKQGLVLQAPAEGVEPDLMITTHLISIRKGSAMGMVWLLFGALGALLGNAAGGQPSVAVTAQVGDKDGLWFVVPVETKSFGGFTQMGSLKSAATLTASKLSREIAKQLKARP
jgi:hypothetical protein